MQQLLTGKKRLPGFSGKWEVKKLGEVLKVRHGKSQHDVVDQNGEIPILGTGGEIGRTKTYLYDKPSVLIGRKGTIDIPQYMDIPFWTIDTLFYTEILTNAFPKFIFYRFNLIDWYSYNEASGVPSLNAKTIENIEVHLPSVEEQKAIAQILSDMDTEIAALEQKRNKYKAIKQGMMQELLTEKTRIKYDVANKKQ
jgi:type I restriction enzyme S subunit